MADPSLSRSDLTPHAPDGRTTADEGKRLRIALDAAELGTWRQDLRTGVVHLDPRGQQHYGVSRSELPVIELMDRIHPDDRERLAREMAEVLGPPGREAFYTEYRTFGPRGDVQHLRVHMRVEFVGDGPGRRPVTGYGSTQDVTGARRAEKLLIEQGLLLRQVEEIAHIGGWEFDIATGRGSWTAETLRIHGLTRMPERGDAGLEHFEGEGRARMESAMAAAVAHGTPYDLELPFVAADGRRKWVRASCRPVMKNGGVARLRGTLQDITDRKQSELALQRFMHASPTIVYVLAVEPDRQRLIRLEGDLERLTGWRPEQVDARRWWRQNIHPEDLPRVLARNPAPYDIDHLSIDFRFRRADGRYMWLHDERRLLRDAAGQPREVVGSWSDITERVELETQLRQSQKLEAIGQLAGGIAHDFNNLLTVIIGTTEILAGSLDADAEALAFVQDIRAAGERAATLTQQLLAFSRKQVLQPAPVNVNEAIDGLERMLRRLIGEHIAVRCELQPDVGYAAVDPGQFQQVLINLAVNARDAMPRGGTLEVRTGLVDASEIPNQADAVAGPHVCITISDSGHGMTPEVSRRIFEPFFTTKPVGRGTGLGLATVFGIVTQSGGHIEVTSAPGAGTTFRIYLPSASSPDAGQKPEVAPHEGRETILLVDDEEGVRRVAAVTLSRHGYHVLEASSPKEALERGSSAEPIDLLLTDVVMPDVSGPELAMALRAKRPTLKVLFMSGYVDDSLDRQELDRIPHALLPKPFSPRELTARVRQVLDDVPK